MTEYLLRSVRALLAILRTLSATLLVCSVAVNFANVVGRYFFNTSIPWAEETMLFLMVGCVFLGNDVVAWSGRHLRMDVVVNALPPRVRAAFDLFSELLLIGTAITIVIVAVPVVRQLADYDQRSQAANIPLAIPQAMIPIGMSIMALLVAVRLFTRAERGPSVDGNH
jgi:TRAP-type C4-dicarboxylate transport system permease small subunit